VARARAVSGPGRPRGGASPWVALCLCVLAGCGHPHAAAPAQPAGATPSHRIAVMAAPGPPGGAMPVVPEAMVDSVSATTYASLEALRDTLERLVRASVNTANRAVRVSRDTVTFQYIYARAFAPGYVVRVVIDDHTPCPAEAIGKALQARGWVLDHGYDADGPDGTGFGLLARDFFCLIEGSWDGGDDVDTSYVPRPGCTVTATVVPKRADDRYR
jgi:hypothetical protein